MACCGLVHIRERYRCVFLIACHMDRGTGEPAVIGATACGCLGTGHLRLLPSATAVSLWLDPDADVTFSADVSFSLDSSRFSTARIVSSNSLPCSPASFNRGFFALLPHSLLSLSSSGRFLKANRRRYETPHEKCEIFILRRVIMLPKGAASVCEWHPRSTSPQIVVVGPPVLPTALSSWYAFFGHAGFVHAPFAPAKLPFLTRASDACIAFPATLFYDHVASGV